MATRVNACELRRQLAVRGLTQSDLARLAGLTPATISHAMAGRGVSNRTFGAVLRALGAVEWPADAPALLAGAAARRSNESAVGPDAEPGQPENSTRVRSRQP